ncbi:NADP-specific glutamate dehydrogenase [Bernardetia sp. Wsw4-3y2]|uniref:NADP-specific glutamate dehydrogenase n=1 Tax=Bernardetia sp. Wsw4-3y2 TaxID=3127471 RepID=UPI0030D0DE25
MSKNNHNTQVKGFIESVKTKQPHEEEFLQAVEEVAEFIIPFIEENPKYKKAKLLERMVEPERAILFRIPWLDDKNEIQINKGFRVQFNSALGPYKGGVRFHPSVNLSILKFLGFEQVFKNSLTGLPLGGGKGGSDFDPKEKSDEEVMRFCQSFVTELFRHIGGETDVPAGDIGVGAREVGYMFGQYKRLANEFTGTFTGKGVKWGGSLLRTEATGYGLLYFVKAMMEHKGDSLENKTVVISGSGNVAQYACEKAMELGAKVVTLSDSDGYIYDEEGITTEKLEFVKELKNEKRGRIKEYAKKYSSAKFHKDKRPWDVKCDIALPCATQNELEEKGAKALVKNGCQLVAEGANMPTTSEAIDIFAKNDVLYSPGKASNAGGVATSGLEMTQNSLHLSWTKEKVDEELKAIMKKIHEQCVEYGKEKKKVNYLKGANIAGFVRVADAMIAQGVV